MALRPPAELQQQAARYAGLRALAARQLTSLWPRVDWTSELAPQAVKALYRAVVAQFGSTAATLAADDYDAQRGGRGLRRRYRATVAEPVDDEQVRRIVESAFRGGDEPLDVNERRRVRVRTSELPVEQRVPQRLDQSLSRLVMQPARDTVARNVERDPARPTWLRVPTGESTCEFCIMLASRELGPHFGGYSSRERALFDDNGQRFHKFCDCLAVACFPDDDPYLLSPRMRDYLAVYQKGAANAGTRTDTKAVLAEMRKIIRAGSSGVGPDPDRDADNPPARSADPLPNVRIKTDTRFDVDEDLAVVNPNFGTADEWGVNCTRCSTAIELRARGYDVSANSKPADVRDNDLASTMARWQSDTGVAAGAGGGTARPRRAERIGMGQTASGSRVFHALSAQTGGRAEIETAVADWGPGSRGYVVLVWKGQRASHIFNVVNDGGTVRFIDGQVDKNDVSEYFTRASPSRPVYLVRTDDLTPNPRVMEWVHESTDADRDGAARRRRTPSPPEIRTAAHALDLRFSYQDEFEKGVRASAEGQPLKTFDEYAGDGSRSSLRRGYYDAYAAGHSWHRSWLSRR